MAKQAIAWVVLAMLGLSIWTMLKPVLPPEINASNLAGANSGQEKGDTTAQGALPEKRVVAGATTTTIASSVQSGPAVEFKFKAQILSRGLNVRKGASIETPVISSVSRGDIVPVYEIKSGWLRIKAKDGTMGYISGSKSLVRYID